MERLQNILSRAGVASRRGAATMIESGRVRVNGEIVLAPGVRFDEYARIEVDGRLVGAGERKRTIMMYKPAGVLSSMSDPFGGRTVADILRGQVAERLVPVGRLDRDSEGLLLMSNDGDLTLRLTHPRYEHEKVYVVNAAGHWDDSKLEVLRSSIEMPDGYQIRPCHVELVRVKPDNITTLVFHLREGRKRQIRYMCSAAHLTVVALKRVEISGVRLDRRLRPGEWRDLTQQELKTLNQCAGR